MISESSINQVRDVKISSVVGHHFTLKKSGSNFIASCPFHSEKSASFVVNDEKGIFHCFGCNAGGDAIGFVMQYEKQTFYEACLTIAKIEGIDVQFEQKELTPKEKADLSEAELQEKVLNFVIPLYHKRLIELPADHPAKQDIYKRGLDDKAIKEHRLGWSGTEWNFVTSQLIALNLWQAAYDLGISKRGDDDRNSDGYRSRIIIPIADWKGRYVGLSGRFIETDPADKGKKFPKYINTSNCQLYNKSNVIFNLYRAAKAIKEQGNAIIVEGNFDAINMQRIGFLNTVATSGTSLPEQQIKLLKKYTNYLLLMRDNDAAGAKANQQQLPELLKHGFNVGLIRYDEKDPDEWVQSLKISSDTTDIYGLLKVEDALISRCKELWLNVNGAQQKTTAKTAILELLALVKNDILRSNYVDDVCNALKWKTTETKKELSKFIQTNETEDNDEDRITSAQFPSWISDEERDNYLVKGYLTINKIIKGKPVVGYYIFSNGQLIEITNCIFTPLFHVYAGVESRFIIQIFNGYRKAVLDIPARSITSIDQFQANIVAEGNYIIFGGKAQWLRIASDILQQFPRCIELRNLGWQTFSFFAFVDKVYIPGQGVKDLSNWGIIKHKDENFLIPASCEAYRQLEQTGQDPFENDRHLTYRHSPVSFERWAMQMQRVYKQQGIVAIAIVIMSLFRDLVFDVDNNCPHLYAFGEPSSGKSKYAESITAAFFHKRQAFNLNSGTDYAFFSYLQRYINCPAHLNEFEIEVIKPEWFEAIKGIFDGEGREKGKQNSGAGSRNRTEVMKVRSVLILTGQKLITANDNSVVTRSIIEGFSVKDDMSEDDKQAYTLLKDWEAKGLSSMLIELLEHREHVASTYKVAVNSLLSFWRKERKDARNLNQRILQNFAHLATGYDIISKFINLPQSTELFNDYCYRQASKWSQFIRNSDTLSEFWRTFEFLVSGQVVIEGWDYRIEELIEVRVRKNREEEEIKSFESPQKVIFIRLNNVHKLFQTAFRSRTGKEAMSIENMLHYFSSRKYYLGAVKKKTFRRFTNLSENKSVGGVNGGFHVVTEKVEQKQYSSCYAFFYDDLNLEIESVDESERSSINSEIPFN